MGGTQKDLNKHLEDSTPNKESLVIIQLKIVEMVSMIPFICLHTAKILCNNSNNN